MKIEVWSDFVCPFCYIGKRRLELALNEFAHRDSVKVEYKSYELDPNTETKPDQNIHEYLALSKNMPLEYVKQMNQNVGEQAAKVGLVYNFDTMQHTNTFDAHRIAKYADTKNLGIEMTEKLLQAYFTDSELISDHDTLIRLAVEVGLDEEEVRNLLDSKRFSSRVREDEDLASQIGIQGVPFFVFNEKYALSGAQPKEIILQVLEKVWEDEINNPNPVSMNRPKSKTTYCTGEECDMDD